MHNNFNTFIDSLDKTSLNKKLLRDVLFTLPLVSIRFNPNKNIPLEALNLKIKNNIPWSSNGYYLETKPIYYLDPYWHNGVYYVQEASSLFLEHIISHLKKKQPLNIVLDLCAAPGGKTQIIANSLPESLIVANELIPNRNTILVENCVKLGADNIVITQNTANQFGELNNFFDLIIYDAPCSGSGLFRKMPEAIQEWSLGNVQNCVYRQKDIFKNIFGSLKEEGYIVYSTCSFSKEENEDQVEWITENYQVEIMEIPIENTWNIQVCINQDNKIVGYYFLPYLLDGEGFFICVFQKKQVENTPKLKEKNLDTINLLEEKILYDNIKDMEKLNTFKHQNTIYLIKPFYEKQIKQLSYYLYLKRIGIEVGQVIRNDFIPAHHLLMNSSIKLKKISSMEFEYSNIIKYLHKDKLEIDLPTNGWYIVTYKTLQIGWIKVIGGNRINNYYPTQWKIRS